MLQRIVSALWSYSVNSTPITIVFPTSLCTHFHPVRPFLPLISAPTGFHDWDLVTRWAQLLITSNYFLPSKEKEEKQMSKHESCWSWKLFSDRSRNTCWWQFLVFSSKGLKRRKNIETSNHDIFKTCFFLQKMDLKLISWTEANISETRMNCQKPFHAHKWTFSALGNGMTAVLHCLQ